jgi:hypothetical protein
MMQAWADYLDELATAARDGHPASNPQPEASLRDRSAALQASNINLASELTGDLYQQF